VKIIIVDDSDLVRKCVREILNEHNDFNCAGEAGNIDEGLRLVLDVKPDVIILDIVMPGGSGLLLLRTVKAMEPGCKVIMLSSDSDEQIRRKAAALGADSFLDKAFEFENLADTIRACSMSTSVHSYKST
jgi:DNA-binding NarL/FixJ family response regulator